jgi:hypothetical protein
VALSIGHGPSIEVFDLASGTMRRWQGSQRADSISSDLLGSNPLSWAADGRTLAFDLAAGRDIEVHLLDTSAPGDSLTASRQVMTFPDWAMTGSVSGSAVITPDGTKVVAMAVPAPLPGRQIQLREYSASTGKQLGVLARLHYRKHAITGWPNVLWTNSSGSRFIVSVTKPGDVPLKNGGMTAETIGILSGGRLTPLPGIPGGERPVW